MWRQVAAALDDGTPFDPKNPKQHASWAYLNGLDWTNVRRSIRAVPDHRSASALLEWLAEAHWRLRERKQAIELWFALCWQAPDRFEHVVHAARFPDAGLRQAWQNLQADGWNEVTAAWLPAWMVLEEPGVARAFKPIGGASAPARAFDLLLRLKAGGSDREDIDNRRALQEVHPQLFNRYLESLDA